MPSVFAVCDIETEYAIRFMEFLNRRNLPFEVQLFTSVPPLCEYAKQKHIELLLISERAMCEEVRNLKVGKLILLSEGKDADYEEIPSVYKYQSSSQVVREVLDCYSAERIAAQASRDIRKKQGKLLGIYSLFDPVRQMMFSLALGQILAETRSVLYLNLQKYAGLMYLTEESADMTLSDLLYYYRQNKGGMSCRLPGMVRQIGRMDFVPVPFFSEDLGELSGEEWAGFLEALWCAGGYDVILMDLGDGLRGLPQILELCTEMFFLSDEDDFSLEKRRLLEEELKNGEEFRPLWLTPPAVNGIRQGRWFLESLPESPMGEYIQRNVRDAG